MTSVTQPLPFSPGPIKLPPGNLETVDEIPGDSDLEDDRSDAYNSGSDLGLSNIEEEDEDDADGEEGSIRERDAVFEKIKETLSKTQRSESVITDLSSVSDSSDSPQVQISQNYTSVPYGIQPRATYEHSSQHADIMGVAYNGRMRQFVILDSKGITTWKRDVVDPRDMKHLEGKDLTPKTFNLNQVRRALQFPKYEYRLIRNIVYAPKYNCYFALGRDFSVKVLNRDFEETCSVNTDMRSVLYILFNPVRDELITGGVAGIKIWQFQQAAGKAFTELKPLANYELRLKETLPNVGGSWVKKVELDYHLQHLYCCSDTDLHVYDLTGKMLFKFERAHTMSITGCCFSPSAKVLITSSVDSEVKIWSLTGGLVHTFRGHSRAVTGMLLHPETSSIIITCSLDGSIRMWSLDTMDLLYMIVVSADGVMWMGLTDDKLLYISTCRNITLWHLNNFCCFWSLARNPVTNLSTASCEEKTTRVLAVGDDSSVRIFCRSNHRNITTVLPPPDISPLQDVLSVSYSREKNAAFLLITNKEIWVYTTRTDPASRIAIWNVHDLQLPYISGDNSNLPPGFDTLFCYPVTWQVSINPLIRSVVIQPPSQLLACHRATENGNGNEIVSNCCSVCILNSTAMMWTDEGLCCPIRHTYLLLGMEDGRILFMDPVIKGQKYMEFKASKDAIQEMKHDMAHSCLITMCRLKTLVLIQVWGLPQLDAMYEVYCAPDVSGISLVGQSMLTGHVSGHVNLHQLEPVEDQGALKSKQEPPYESVVDDKRRPEHQSPVVAMDSLASLQIFISCSSDGAIKVWEENKVLLTEVMLDKSLSSATFLNDMGDLLVGFKNHVFYIDHTKLCPTFKPPEIEMETSDQESDVYEDPRVLYELIKQDDEPVTLENYLVPYDHLEFDKDFLEGKTRIEQPKTAAEALESSETETETDISLAPSSIYLSPAESIESLSMIDLTLGADYSKYDLRDQMKATLDQIGTRAKEDQKWAGLHPARVYLKLRKLQLANAKVSKYVHRKKPKGKKRFKTITIETPAQSDMEEREIEMELEKFSLPLFGESPGGSPCITPPSGQASPRSREHLEDMEQYSDDEGMPKPSGFVPIMPDTAYSSAPSARGSTSTRTLTSESYKQRTLTPSSPTKSQSYLHTSANIEEYSPRVSNQTRKQSALQDFEEYYQTSAVKRSSVAKGQPRKSVDKTGHSHTTGQREDADVTDSETMLSSKRSSEVTLVTHDQRSESEYDSLVSEEIDDKSQTKSRPLSVTTDLSEKESADRDLQSRSGLDLDMQSEADSCTATSDSDTQSPTKTSDNELLLITAISDIDITDKPDEIDKGDLEKSRSSSEGVKAGGTMEAPEAGYGDEEEVDEHGRRVKGSKVDMRGLMKKRRITSGRAPSLTRRSSADHAHDDHDHEHGHDDKRKEIKKKQKEDRKLSIHQQQQQPQQQQRVDISKLANLPPNPPSMLSRKRSLSEQRKNLDLLHRPDNHKQMDPNDPNLAQIHFDQDHTDADQLQEELWASEAAVHGQTLALPPQKDKNKARLMDRPAQIDSRAQRLKDRKHMLGERDSVEGQTPGVGSSPTAELEQEENQMETTEPRETTDKSKDKKVEKSDRTQNDSAQSGDAKTGVSCEATIEGVSDLDTNAPETQMQRTKRLGYKLDSDKVFDSDKKEHTEGTPNVLINRRNRSKLNVYIPQAERESISSARSSRRGTPDSGIDDGVSHQGSQASRISRVKGLGVPDTDEFGDVELPAPDGTLLSEEDKVATRRPASSFTGLRRGQLEGEKLRAERPHTAHVRFKAEDLQTAFQEALQRYQNLPGTPAFVSADTLYRNDGVSFEDNWQDRVIERHTLLRMQKEIRAQSAAQRRQAIETIQKDKHSSKLFTSRCDSAIGGFTNPDSASIQTVRRANTSMSVPINLGYGVHSAPPTARPNTANPALEKQQMIKNELSQEKAFRFRLSKDAPPALPKSRPSSSRSISTVADFSPHWIDPRNPDAWRPKSSRSIPSKCNRYILVNKPKERPSKPVPSPLEEQLLVERFPKMGSKIVQSYVPDLSPRIKKSYNMEYSPFVYQRFV